MSIGLQILVVSKTYVFWRDCSVTETSISKEIQARVDISGPFVHLLLGHVHIVGLKVVLQVAVNGELLEDDHSAGFIVEDVPCGDTS